ncbi:MAG TPA: hypothetical protein VL614_09955 [Acetobacteraceae bacterium]|nr:hypothetical protein [Acetobacteraceae bacterium]
MAKGATIKADATDKGDGGRITVLSGGTTVMNGTITAMGGPFTGNGGFVETSGGVLGVGTMASINVAAKGPGKQAGTWLLDPFDIDITTADNNTSATKNTFTASGESATIANTTLQTALGNGKVVISTAGQGKLDQGNITVSAPVTWTSANSLTLSADNDILIDAPISTTKGGLVLNAGTTTATGSITINAPVAPQGFAATAGTAGTINLNFDTAPVVTTGGAGQTYNSAIVLQADASITETGNGPIVFASTLNAAKANGQSVTVNAGAGTVTFAAALGDAQPFNIISATGGSIVLGGNITSSALTLASTKAATALAIATTIDTGALSLNSGGAITEAGVITATSLTGGAAGAVGLTKSNSIASVGSFAVTGSGNSFSLTNSADQDLSISGQLTAVQDVVLRTSGTGSVTVTGSISAGRSLVASAGSGGIALNTGDALSGTVVDFSTTGGIAQVTTGTIVATTLQSSGGVTGNVDLLGVNNAITRLGGFAVGGTGNFALVDGSGLTVNGTVSVAGATAQLFLQAPTLSVAATTGALEGDTGTGLVSLETDNYTNNGAIAAATVEFAPITTTQTVTLGTTGSGLSLPSLANVTTTNLVIGALTQPDSTRVTTAAGISIGGPFDVTGTNLALFANGPITQSAILGAKTLSGSATSVSLANAGNLIATLGNFTANSGALVLDDAGVAGALTVSGTVKSIGGDVSITAAPTLSVTGSINASGTVLLSSGAGGISLAANSALTGKVVDVTTTGTLAEDPAAVVAAATLQSTGGVGGAVTLFGSLNAVSNLGTFASAGDFALMDHSALSVINAVSVAAANNIVLQSANAAGITVGGTGSLSAPTVSIEADSFTNSGAIISSAFDLGPNTKGGTVTLGATGSGLSLTSLNGITAGDVTIGVVIPPGGSRITTAGSINIAGAFAASGTLEFDATGAVTQSAPLTGGTTLLGSAGSIALLNKGNAISSIGLTANSGNLQIADTSALTVLSATAQNGSVYLATTNAGGITVTGANLTAASSGTVGLQADAVTGLATANENAGTFELAPSTSGMTMTLGDAGGLSLASLAGIGSGTVRLGAVTVPGTVAPVTTAGSIVVGGNFGNASTVLDLWSLGTIIEAGTSALTASSLTGRAGGDVSLTNNNTIATLAGFNDSGSNFALTDTGPLDVSNTVSGSSVTLSDNSTLTINGTATATVVSLAASTIAIPGLVDGVVVGLFGGSVNESGTLIATALTGTMSGAATLTGATTSTNQVRTVADFTATGFTLDDGSAVTVSGALAGGSDTTLLATGDVTVGASGSVKGNAISLTGADIIIAGASNDGGGTTTLVATSGTITVPGALASGTLSGSTTTSATLLGATPTTNRITTLADFSAPGGFTLDNGTALTVTGTVAGGPSATILDRGALAINGTVTATAINLTADSIAIPGLVNGGSVRLFGTVGAISETGTLIATALTGSAATSATLTGATATANQIGTLAGFTTSTAFALDDGVALTVANTVSGGASATIIDSGLLTNNGTVTATSISLTAGDISNAGLVNGGSVSLFGTLGAITDPGTLDAVVLTGSAMTSASLTGATTAANHIGTITNFTAGSGFTVDDGQSLTVANTISGGPSATILDKGALTIDGTVTAASVGLTADSINIPGLVSGGTVALFGTVGAISESGQVIADSLTGSAASSASLGGATAITNQISIVNGFTTASGFLLNDGVALAVNNTLSAGAGATIVDSGALTINGGVSATVVRLTADTIAIPGVINSGTVVLAGTVDAVSETGTIIAGTLSGSAITGVTLTGANATANHIGIVSGLTAGSGITLDDGIDLTVTGLVSGGPRTTISDKGTLSVNGSVTGTAISLTGDSIAIPGVVNGSTVSLAGTVGSISETGTIIATSLTGSAATNAALIGLTPTTNKIGTLNGFTTQSGFALDDGISLNVGSTLSGGTAAAIVDAGALTVSGSIVAGTVSLTGSTIGMPGLVNGSAVTLLGTVGAISETGAIIAGTLTGRVATTATLTGANQIGVVNGFTAPSGFTLTDGTALSLVGTISGGPNVSILDNGALAINGAVTASTIGLTADTMGIAGNISGSAVTLISTTGAISETGELNASSLTGTAATAAKFAGTNQIGTLNGFSAPGGFSLNDGIALSVSGAVSGGPRVAIADSSSLTISGNVSASAISLSATDITIPGSVTGTTTSLLASSGTIIETGAMNVGTLTGSSTGTATFTGNNAIASLSNFTADGLTLIDNSDLGIIGVVQAGPYATITTGGSLAVTGALFADAIALRANSILIPGEVADANSVSLVTGTGSILETGLLIADVLTASATGDIMLTGNGSNQIATLGSIGSGATFTLNDSINLLINGPLAAPKIVINAPASNVTLADGATIATGGTTRPPGTVTNYPSTQTSSAGAFITAGNFFQLGNSTVVGVGNPGNPNIIRITVPGGGNIAFSQSGGLTGNTSWLILDLGTGQATGGVFVRNLDVIRSGTSGGTNLVGTINGISGAAAAGAANIGPTGSASFRFNSCPIHSVNCVLLPPLGLPVANPLNEIYIGSIYNPNDQDDLLLPIVSDQDY